MNFFHYFCNKGFLVFVYGLTSVMQVMAFSPKSIISCVGPTPWHKYHFLPLLGAREYFAEKNSDLEKFLSTLLRFFECFVIICNYYIYPVVMFVLWGDMCAHMKK